MYAVTLVTQEVSPGSQESSSHGKTMASKSPDHTFVLLMKKELLLRNTKYGLLSFQNELIANSNVNPRPGLGVLDVYGNLYISIKMHRECQQVWCSGCKLHFSRTDLKSGM